MPTPFRSNLQSLSRILFLGAVASLTPSVVACGGESDEDPAATGGTSGTSNVVIGGGTGNTGNNGSGGGNTVSMNGNMCVIEDDGSDCVGQAYEGEALPLDIYVMFDQSGSMCKCVDPVFDETVLQACPNDACDQTRMEAVREAARLFMDDPESQGVGIGIGYFGKQPLGEASCEDADYEAAAVGIGVLPDHAADIMDSLNGIEPTGETPTGPAIRGACSYASAWKSDHPANETVILLLTDGKPEAPVTCGGGSGPCCPTLDDAVAAATSCREDAGIKTYVLGVGPLLGNLQKIAEAGGTQEAYLVEGGDVANEVLNALRAIRGDAIPCSMPLPTPPDGSVLNLDQVNITYASAACEPTYFYRTTQDSCDDGGWYYDDSDPPQIQLCPTSCDQVSAPGGKLVYTIGCDTRIVPR